MYCTYLARVQTLLPSALFAEGLKSLREQESIEKSDDVLSILGDSLVLSARETLESGTGNPNSATWKPMKKTKLSRMRMIHLSQDIHAIKLSAWDVFTAPRPIRNSEQVPHAALK